MERYLSFASIPAAYKRKLSLILWTLGLLVLLAVLRYFVYQWFSHKSSREKIKEQGTFIAEQGLVIKAIKKNSELDRQLTEVLIKNKDSLLKQHEQIKEVEALKTQAITEAYNNDIAQASDPATKELLNAKRDTALLEIRLEALWATYCNTPGADLTKTECEVAK